MKRLKMKFITTIIALAACINICGSVYAFDADTADISTNEKILTSQYTINSINRETIMNNPESDTVQEVTVNVTKVSGQNKNECLFIALYDLDERLLCTDSTILNLNEGDTKSYSFTVDTKKPFTGYTKAFVWDSFYSMKPLATAAEKFEGFGDGGIRGSMIIVNDRKDLQLTEPGTVEFKIIGGPYKAGWFKADEEIASYKKYVEENPDKITMIDCTQKSFNLNIDSNGLYVFVAWSSPDIFTLTKYDVTSIDTTQ